MKTSLVDLERGIKGLVVMSTDLEETFNCIFDGRVPPLWEKVSKVYHHMPSLFNKFESTCYIDLIFVNIWLGKVAFDWKITLIHLLHGAI